MTATQPYTASVHVEADPERVFDYFTKPEAILRWMGDHAVLDPVPGGQFTLDVNGVPVRGRYLAVERPHRLLISWGHAGSDRLPPGASTLEVVFTPRDGGTTVTVVHAGLPAPEASQHRLGWAHFLDRRSPLLAAAIPAPTLGRSVASPAHPLDRFTSMTGPACVEPGYGERLGEGAVPAASNPCAAGAGGP